MATEQQPEETATKPLAALASAAGSYTQTQMYGRGLRQRPDSTRATDEAAPAQPPDADRSSAATPDATSVPLDEPAKPVTQPAAAAAAADSPPDAPSSGASATTASDTTDLEVASDVVAACSEQDAVAAQARLVQGQQLELPPAAPSAPGIGPAL